MHGQNRVTTDGGRSTVSRLGRQRDLLGNGPHKGTQFPGDGDDDLIGMFPSGAQLPIAFAQPHLGLPTDILDRLGQLLQAQLEMPADFGRVAIGPGAFDQGTAGMGIARLGDAALATPLATGVFRGREAQIIHELSGVIEDG